VAPTLRHLVLVGLMGSGKSTVARRLSQRLHHRMVDLDAVVEAQAGCTIAELFARRGEAAFRDMESQVLAAQLASPEPSVIATGGGAVVREGNRHALAEAPDVRVVWLDARPEDLVRRVGGSAATRPLLADDPRGVLERLDRERRPLYGEVADHRIDTAGRSLDEVVEAVDTWWRMQCRSGGEEEAS